MTKLKKDKEDERGRDEREKTNWDWFLLVVFLQINIERYEIWR